MNSSNKSILNVRQLYPINNSNSSRNVSSPNILLTKWLAISIGRIGILLWFRNSQVSLILIRMCWLCREGVISIKINRLVRLWLRKIIRGFWRLRLRKSGDLWSLAHMKNTRSTKKWKNISKNCKTPTKEVKCTVRSLYSIHQIAYQFLK